MVLKFNVLRTENGHKLCQKYTYPLFSAQKISPDSKEKVQLQLVLHDGGANTFHFINPKGRSAAIADRDGVKDLLQQLIPKFRRKLSSELEEKNRCFKEKFSEMHWYISQTPVCYE